MFASKSYFRALFALVLARPVFGILAPALLIHTVGEDGAPVDRLLPDVRELPATEEDARRLLEGPPGVRFTVDECRGYLYRLP